MRNPLLLIAAMIAAVLGAGYLSWIIWGVQVGIAVAIALTVAVILLGWWVLRNFTIE